MLNSAKLFYPPRTEDYVPRVRLQERLKVVARRPLTLVSAPAGYGKTTAVSAWLESSRLIRAWLSLDEGDNHLASFMAYLVAAIRRQVAGFGLELSEMIDHGVPLSARTFVEQLALHLDNVASDVALVLDDFHSIRDADALAVIGEMMRHPHPRLHLVLVSRHDPQLPLSEWRARNQMVDIRSGDLRFSLEEATAFLIGASTRPLDSAAIAQLYASTEGWVAGLRLAALSLSLGQDENAGRILERRGGNWHTLEFLADQVLAALPASWQSYLMRTSILERMSEPLCKAVVGAAPDASGDAPALPEGQELLREMYRENLFIIALDGEQHWFRYHHLFREFLRSRLERVCSPAEIAALHLRASRWLGEAGYVEDAIRHAQAGGAMREAILLFAAHRHELFNEERFGRLLALQRLFPEQVIRSSPNLLMMEAWLAFVLRFDPATFESLAREVDALLEQLDIEPEMERTLRAETAVAKAMAAYFNLDAEAALRHSQNALLDLPPSHYTVGSFARLTGAMALQMQGQLSEALEFTRSGFAEDLALPGSPRGRNLGNGAFLHWMAGNLGGVEKLGEHLVSVVPGDSYSITWVWAHYFLACVHYQRNNLAQALSHAQTAFEGRLHNPGFFAVYIGLVLAACHQAAGDAARADEVMVQVRAAAVALQSTPLLDVAQAFEVEVDVARGRLDHAVAWAEQRLSLMPLMPLGMFYAPPLTVAKALLAANDPARAALLGDYLSKWRVCLESSHNVRFLLEVLALEALHLSAQGDEAAALAALARSLSLAEPSGFVRVYLDLGPRMRELLGRLRQTNARATYADRLLAAFAGSVPVASQNGLIEPLTERELEILALLAGRYSNKEIARELYIAPGTVKRHTINIYQKLSVESRREAVEAARELGILQ